MGTVIQRYADTKINTQSKSLLDNETGEIIEIKDVSIMERKSTGEISISSNEYVYLDTEALNSLLKKGIKQVDLALLISISGNLLTGSNICMKDSHDPHTTASIGKLTDKTEQAVKTQLNRLIKLGTIHYGILKENKRYGKVYIINPHLIRKGVKLKGSLATIFNPI